MPHRYFHNILQLLLECIYMYKKWYLTMILFPKQVGLTCVSRALKFFVWSFSSRTQYK